MSALSIELPDELADTSRAIAQRLGLTQSELVRRALVNESANFNLFQTLFE